MSCCVSCCALQIRERREGCELCPKEFLPRTRQGGGFVLGHCGWGRSEDRSHPIWATNGGRGTWTASSLAADEGLKKIRKNYRMMHVEEGKL